MYLTGAPSEEVIKGSASDEVLFLNYSSKDIRGLKLAAIRDFKRLVSTRDFAFCIAHRFKPIYIALLGSKLPVVGIQHAFGVYKRKSRRYFANFFCQRLRLLGVSDAVRDDIRACLPKFPEQQIKTFYNRVDLEAVQAEQLSREQSRKFLGLPQGAWIVGNVGRLHPDKDQATLIKGFSLALPSLPEGSLLVIMGKGRLEQRLKSLAVELGIASSVIFLGQIPQARRYFKAFDIFALSSDHEPFGMVLLEAMAAGVSAIATNCGGAKEIVPPDALFELGDASMLADLIVSESTISRSVSIPDKFTDTAAARLFMEMSSMPWSNE